MNQLEKQLKQIYNSAIIMKLSNVKNTCKHISMFFIFLLFLSSCNSKMDNPLMNFQMGEDEDIWKAKIEQNVNEGFLTQQFEDDTRYRYYFTKAGDSIFADVHFNPDGYDFGKLRSVKFDLRGDTAYYTREKKYIRSFGRRDIKTVDKLLDWFIKYYGPPTDSIPHLPAIITNTFPGDTFIRAYDIFDKPGTLIWEKENYRMAFYRSKKFSPIDDSTSDNFYLTAYILYQIKSYEEELKKITEAIRLNFTPQDLVRINIGLPMWENLNNKDYWGYDYEFKINVNSFRRIGDEEIRSITDVQFDIILSDTFEKEICRIPDVKFESKTPIELYKKSDPIIGFTHTIQYSSRSNEKLSSVLEKARKFNKNNKLKVHAEVTAVVFEDGEVLK